MQVVELQPHRKLHVRATASYESAHSVEHGKNSGGGRCFIGYPGDNLLIDGGTCHLFQKGPNDRIQRNFIVVPCDQHVILNPDNSG